jgi:hypothetical protein
VTEEEVAETTIETMIEAVVAEDQADLDLHQEVETELQEEVVVIGREIEPAKDTVQDLSQLTPDHQEEVQAAEATIEEEIDKETIVDPQEMIRSSVQRDLPQDTR